MEGSEHDVPTGGQFGEKASVIVGSQTESMTEENRAQQPFIMEVRTQLATFNNISIDLGLRNETALWWYSWITRFLE